MRPSLFTAIAAAGLLVASAASAEMVHYTAKLAGASGVKGSGDVFAMLEGKTLTYTVNYKDLSGPATMAHFHGPAAQGANAPPVVVVPDNAKLPIGGSVRLTDEQMADLLAGKWYFNVHTAANPGGEIRGTLAKQ